MHSSVIMQRSATLGCKFALQIASLRDVHCPWVVLALALCCSACMHIFSGMQRPIDDAV